MCDMLIFPGEHLQKNISEAYNNLDVSFEEFPKDGKTDPNAYKAAIDALPKGSASKLQRISALLCTSSDIS